MHERFDSDVMESSSARTVMDRNHGKYMAVLYTKPADCGGSCLYCIRESGVTRSTLVNEDTLLARNVGWSSAAQLRRRVECAGLPIGAGLKFELRIKGNSFTNYDPSYLESYIKQAYDLLNGHISEEFEESFERQLTGADRCVQIVVETRPDKVDDEWCRIMRRWGITTVELGVQSLSDKVLDANRRGHGVAAVISATQLLRDHGFELGYQVMVGLPGSTREVDGDMLSHGLWVECLYPDTLKVYPCVATVAVHAQPQLYRALRRGQWVPFTDSEYQGFLREVVPHFPPDVHVNRLQRIFPPEQVRHGPAGLVDRRLHDQLSRCMWQRSLNQRAVVPDADLSSYQILEHRHGREVCLQAIHSSGALLGYARVSCGASRPLLRDLRVLGRPLAVGEVNSGCRGAQHIGIGRSLLATAELVALAAGGTGLTVPVSAGAAQYFLRAGYAHESPFTVTRHLSPERGAP